MHNLWQKIKSIFHSGKKKGASFPQIKRAPRAFQAQSGLGAAPATGLNAASGMTLGLDSPSGMRLGEEDSTWVKRNDMLSAYKLQMAAMGGPQNAGGLGGNVRPWARHG